MSNAGEYIYTVIVAAVFSAVLQTILPEKGTAKSMIRLTLGVFLFIVILSPFIKVRVDGMLAYVSNIETDASTIIAEAQENTAQEIRGVILQNTEAYILGKAADLGADIRVEITLQEDGSFTPKWIKITGAISPMAKKQLSAVIKSDLGISEELQTWVLA